MAAALAALLVVTGASRAAAQGAGFEAGYLIQGDNWISYRLGLERPLVGPLDFQLYGTHIRSSGTINERLWGGGADLIFYRGDRQGPYAVGGLSAGLSTEGRHDLWGSWSAGLGYQLVPLHFLSIATEARWRRISEADKGGVELSVRLGALFGRARPGPGAEPRPSPLPSPLAPGSAATTLGDSVVMTAAQQMGAEYRLGGTGAGGFDCSGLIQYAYAQHGVSLPRVSTEQAKEGREVPRRIDALRPGDILTFSNSGGPVTHVGLYVGDTRFIHSANGGVQLSLLSENDPYGRWWFARWVGVRRIAGENGR